MAEVQVMDEDIIGDLHRVEVVLEKAKLSRIHSAS